MRWLVTGSGGMLGTDLCEMLIEQGEEVTGLGSADLDIRDLEAVRAAVRRHQVIVNAARWTAVDDAEANEATAFAVNAVGAHNVALAAKEFGARTVQISTEYVFDGLASSPYLPAHLNRHVRRMAAPKLRVSGPCGQPTHPRSWCRPPGCTANMGRTSSRRCCEAPKIVRLCPL